MTMREHIAAIQVQRLADEKAIKYVVPYLPHYTNISNLRLPLNVLTMNVIWLKLLYFLFWNAECICLKIWMITLTWKWRLRLVSASACLTFSLCTPEILYYSIHTKWSTHLLHKPAFPMPFGSISYFIHCSKETG